MKSTVDVLPALEGVFSSTLGSSDGRSRAQPLLSVVRQIAKTLRRQKSRRFYSVREMAVFLNVSVGTVTGIYQRLEQEGVLTRIRGSRTMLVGRQLSPRIPIRAVVGIVALRFSLIANPDTRALDMELIERLSQRGYVADLIFHAGDTNEPGLVEHLVRHRVDIALLRVAGLKIRQNILALRDRGIRTIVLQDKIMSPDLPAVIYQQDWSPAYERLAHRWQKDGIRRAFIPMKVHLRKDSAAILLRSIFASCGIDAEFCDHDFAFLLKATRHSHAAVAFMDRFRAGRICNRQPLDAEKLLGRTRVAFCRGPIYVPYLCHRETVADVVVFSSSQIAERIALDVGKVFERPDGVQHVFTADLLEGCRFEDPIEG